MAGARLGPVKQFVLEAVQAWLKERDEHVKPYDPVREGPPYPQVSGDKIAEWISWEQGTLEKSRKQLVRRLQRFRYPYGTTARVQKSFYVHARRLGLLNFF